MKDRAIDRNAVITSLHIAFFCLVLTAALDTGFAAVTGSLRLDTRLIRGTRTPSPARFIVRDLQGLSDISRTCSQLRCQLLQNVGDPDGQLFVVQGSVVVGAA